MFFRDYNNKQEAEEASWYETERMIELIFVPATTLKSSCRFALLCSCNNS